MAGAVGFEPTNVGTKTRCLTTWRQPIDYTYILEVRRTFSMTTVRTSTKVDEFISRVTVVSKPKVTKKTVTQESEPNLIPLSAYWEDAKERWKIHTKEVNDLWKDLKASYEKARPYIEKAIEKGKELIGKIKTLLNKTK